MRRLPEAEEDERRAGGALTLDGTEGVLVRGPAGECVRASAGLASSTY